MIGRRDFFFFVPALLLSILTPLFLPSSSVSLSYFIFAVPKRECLGKHSYMSSPFPIAKLNGYRSFVYQNHVKLTARVALPQATPHCRVTVSNLFIVSRYRLQRPRISSVTTPHEVSITTYGYSSTQPAVSGKHGAHLYIL